ncbi:MAG: lipopolysaccharide heptosyltransferase II [Pelagibacterales bacterium]|nr:lipopolysaccharide heptosyltransferase II [Pelagibacterales bacterium]|tara:strand:+ start:182 stop:1195 length:1014 start_codon:yes stop_codon:yes gene_type:complete
MKSNEKFLVIAPSWIGDLVISQSFLKQLKLFYPKALIDVIARKELFPILNFMPEVNNLYNLDIKHGSLGLIKRYKLAKKIALNSYTKAFVLTNSFKSAIIPWLAGIPVRVGYLGELRYGLINKTYHLKKHQISMADRYYKLIDSTYHDNLRPELLVNEKEKKIVNKKFNIDGSKKNIFLCPDAEYGEAKRWPTKKWIELALEFKKQNYQTYFLGKDLRFNDSLNQVIKNNDKSIVSLISKTNIEEAAYLLASSDLVITNDSGLMHVASSVNAELIAIYGSSSPEYTPPLSKPEKHRIIYKNIECSPCFKKICPLGHFNCMHTISINEVIGNASILLR